MRSRAALLSALLLVLMSFAGQARADIASASATNVQDGDNDSETDQDGEAGSGDFVGGQVIGVVSSGNSRVDATNRSEDINGETGDAEGVNAAAAAVGLFDSALTTQEAADVASLFGGNVQNGDNEADVEQTASALSGDAVGGQVAGVVTPSGGTADLVLANTSIDVDLETGDADQENLSTTLVGLFRGATTGACTSAVLDVGDDLVLEGNDLRFLVTASCVGAADATAADAVTPQADFAINFTASTGGGSATPKADYSPIEGGFTIPAGSNSTTVPVPTTQTECNFEQNETVNLTITAGGNATVGDGVGQGTIVEDDCEK